jgi:site-specific DNA-methyltransferase (adenine-specific)
MISQTHIESLYSYLDGTSKRLEHELEFTYLDGFLGAVENLLQGEVTQDGSAAFQAELTTLLASVKTISFHPEEIRRAVQLALLKGFKEDGISNAEMTPDTIGIFIAYLIERCSPKTSLSVFDPIAGTGNLLITIRNHLSKKATLFAVEHDEQRYPLLQAFYELLELEDHAYFQDTFTFYGLDADVLVMDFSPTDAADTEYMPYQVLVHHHQNLRDGGLCFAVIYDDFFDQAESQAFRKLIETMYQVVALFQLPDTLFRGVGKSILMLQKRGANVANVAKALAVKLPDFQDEASSRATISHIDQWIEAHFSKGETI